MITLFKVTTERKCFWPENEEASTKQTKFFSDEKSAKEYMGRPKTYNYRASMLEKVQVEKAVWAVSVVAKYWDYNEVVDEISAIADPMMLFSTEESAKVFAEKKMEEIMDFLKSTGLEPKYYPNFPDLDNYTKVIVADIDGNDSLSYEMRIEAIPLQ